MVENKTKKQRKEYNLLNNKLNYISGWLMKNQSILKTAHKKYYLGEIDNQQVQLLNMKRHLLEKETRIKKLLWH